MGRITFLAVVERPMGISRTHAMPAMSVEPTRGIYQLADNDKAVRVATIRHRSVAYGSDPR